MNVMKKQRRGQYLIIAALLVLVGGFITYRAMLTVPSAEMTPEARVLAILEEGGCVSCHTANPKVPFYAHIPVAGDMVMKDIEEGYRAYDIEPAMAKLKEDGMPNPVDVAKIEKVAQDKRMPMAKYYLVHWGSQMTDEKAAVIASWHATTAWHTTMTASPVSVLASPYAPSSPTTMWMSVRWRSAIASTTTHACR